MKIKFLFAALAASLLFALPAPSASAYIGVSVNFAPPSIPIYSQPYCPAPGYLWAPGYWGYGPYGYYWVPGSWVRPPRIGLLWTPGYWGYNGGRYLFNQGYWGPTVGFYGGINYGYGYGGYGYYGGRWTGNTFSYNTAVTRVNTSVIRNTYVNREVINDRGSRAGFNGPGGAQARPTAQQRVLAKSQRVAPTSAQRSRVEAARKDPSLRAKNNGGKPKADAVQTFHNKNQSGRDNAAAADRPSRADRASRNDRASRAERAPRAQPAEDNNRSQTARTRNAPQRSRVDQNAAAKRANDRQERAAQANRNRERPAARASQANRAERNVQRRPEVERNRQVRKAPAQTRSTRQTPSVQRRPQTARSRQQAAPQRRNEPAQAQQNAKKKKKRGNQPDDQ